MRLLNDAAVLLGAALVFGAHLVPNANLRAALIVGPVADQEQTPTSVRQIPTVQGP